MNWFKILQTIYWALNGADIIKDWVWPHDPEFHWARKKSGRSEKPASSSGPEWGMLGFAAGLHDHQKINPSTWVTLIPWEFHLRRKPIPERVRLAEQHSATFPPEVIEFYLNIQFFDYNFFNDQFGVVPIKIRATEEFEEVTLNSMIQENTSGATLVSLGKERPEASTTPEQVNAASGHPTYFAKVTPFTPTRMHDWELGWVAWLEPDGFGLVKKAELQRWFSYDTPWEVSLGPIKSDRAQEIGFDSW